MKIIISILFLVFKFNLLFSQTNLKGINLNYGTYAVGFQHYVATDSTRTYNRIYDWTNTSKFRPIPISVWYPSNEKSDKDKAMTVLNYMDILKEEEEWEYLPSEQILNWFYYANTDANQNHLIEATMAYSRITPGGGKFPVVVYAPSYQASSIENFALCEFLASHGYVVISSPSRGTENRFMEGGTVKDMETQARDIEFLIKEIGKYPYADINQLATMGFSFGGLSNVLSQMRNEKIKAIVSLDGSIKYQYGTLKKSSFFDIKKVDVPFIHMAQKDIPKQVLIEDQIDSTLNSHFEFYDSLIYSEAYQLKFHNLTHSYFSTLGVLFAERDKRQDKSDPLIMESYKWVSVYALKFLDVFLKHETREQPFLENIPEQNGIKSDLISLKKKNSQSRPFTFQDFNDLALKQNYENLGKLYDSILKRNPSIEFPEGSLNNLGLQLIFNPVTSRQGIEVFHLATRIYPNSANLYDSMGEGYLFIGDKLNAIQSFKKSLSLNKDNQNAVNRLHQLQEQKPFAPTK